MSRTLCSGASGLVVALGLLSSCSDDAPTTAPTATVTRAQLPAADFPSGTVLHIVSGEGGAPVANAQVTIGAAQFTSDESGNVTIPTDFDDGTLVDISEPGFLLRQTRLRLVTATRFSLWPKESSTGLNEDFVFDVVYHLSASGESRRLMRISPGTPTAYVAPTPRIGGDFRAMRAVRDSVEELNDIASGEIHFVVDANPPPGSVQFELVVDPTDPNLGDDAIALAYRRLSGWNIIGGTVVYDSLDTARTSATHHELGHMFGLGHSNSRADVMFPSLRRRVETFSSRERLVMRLILQRPAANKTPDNDRDVRSALTLATEWVSVVRCF